MTIISNLFFSQNVFSSQNISMRFPTRRSRAGVFTGSATDNGVSEQVQASRERDIDKDKDIDIDIDMYVCVCIYIYIYIHYTIVTYYTVLYIKFYGQFSSF